MSSTRLFLGAAAALVLTLGPSPASAAPGSCSATGCTDEVYLLYPEADPSGVGAVVYVQLQDVAEMQAKLTCRLYGPNRNYLALRASNPAFNQIRDLLNRPTLLGRNRLAVRLDPRPGAMCDILYVVATWDQD